MSTTINQIIEVKINGKWEYVPLADKDNRNDMNQTLGHQGSVRDLFAYKWHNAENYMNFGVPEDISKEAREAMIYEDEDFINSGACWISWQQYEALSESLHQKMNTEIEKLVSAKTENASYKKLSDRLDRIENALLSQSLGKTPDETVSSDDECDDECTDEDYIRENLEDYKYAWVACERNMSEIEAYIDRYLNQDTFNSGFQGMSSGVRVIMYVS